MITIHQRHRRTDGRTDGQTDGRHAIPRPRICTKVHCTVKILETSVDSDTGYILEVDLEYPKELHDRDNDYPLAPEILEVQKEQLANIRKI